MSEEMRQFFREVVMAYDTGRGAGFSEDFSRPMVSVPVKLVEQMREAIR